MKEPATRQTGNCDQSTWVAYEIHDGILPWVTGALLHLSAVQASPETQAFLDTALTSLRHAAEESRALVDFLEKPSIPHDLSLISEIQKLVDRLTPLADRAQQSISIPIHPTAPLGLKSEHTWSVLRIVQQAMQNAIQHAGKAQIQICIQSSDSCLIVEVSDNGIGFELGKCPDTSFGMNSMTERAKALHGTLEVSSAIGSGTRVRLTVPVTDGSAKLPAGRS